MKGVPGEAPAYRSVHNRLNLVRGKASTHICVDCGEQAREWAFDNHDGDDVLYDERGCAYSLDLDSYAPRCIQCHRKFDGRTGRDQCTVSWCPEPHRAKGFCWSHYRRNVRYGSPQFRWATKADLKGVLA